MKKIILLLVVFCAPFVSAKPYNDYTFQKQLIVTYGEKAHTCQAVRIHKNWFLTAAHCLVMCQDTACKTRILLAQGDNVSAYASFASSDIIIPEGYREITNKGVQTHTFWDIALLRYRKNITYEDAHGSIISRDDFQQALDTDKALKIQWKGATSPKIPTLYVYQGENEREISTNLTVPLWDNGEMTLLSEPEQVLYFGQNHSLWGSAGFGVDEGNSGGGVYLSKDALLGIATAKRVNDLPEDVRRDYPAFQNNSEFFIFNGFSRKTTFAFIENTLSLGEKVRTKELEDILEPTIVGQ